MRVGDIYPKVTARDGFGVVQRIELYRHNGANSSWRDKKCGAAWLSHNDGLCDVYQVVLDGRMVGIVEDYGRRISLHPDLDDVASYDVALRAVREGLS